MKYAAEDLQYLDGLAPSRPVGEIFGTVAVLPEGRGPDMALPGSAVILKGEDGTKTTTSDSEGHYSFRGLRPSTYRVSATHPEFRMPAFEHDGVEASVEARGCAVAGVVFRKNWPGTIGGRLTRSDGTPAKAGLDLQLIRVEGRGKKEQSTMLSFEAVKTNERGEYVFRGVAPGRYKIVMHWCCFPTPEVPYPAIYWPAAHTESAASEIKIENFAAGRRYDFRLSPEIKR